MHPDDRRGMSPVDRLEGGTTTTVTIIPYGFVGGHRTRAAESQGRRDKKGADKGGGSRGKEGTPQHHALPVTW